MTDASEAGKFSAGIFIDLRKAFDTVDHNILIDKLEMYGVRGLALSWLKSYLSGRQQYTSYDNTHSEKLAIKCGVPQGSVLGLCYFCYTLMICAIYPS